MFDRSMLGLPMLLFAASCVPQAMANTAPDKLDAAALAKAANAPVPTAAVEPPPLPELAKDIAVGSPASPFDLRQASDHDAQTALECLTAAIYYEARSESEGGQRAVAQVVLNRVRHPAFPKSVCGVVYQGSNRTTGCQFSFTCDGSLARGRQPGPWERARRIAEEALSGYVYDPVGLATHYHTTAIHPWWADALTKAVTIGNHIFYRWRGEWGDPKSFRRPYVGAEAYAAWRSSQPASPDAPEQGPKPEIVFGVAVHREASADANPAQTALEAEAGVRVHRAGTRRIAPVQVAAADPAPVGEAPESIRVHRGGDGGEAGPVPTH
ncbi:MAG TPA: cell wall hydrolase [Allosphingosinicella sp.]|jgi:spore germination cell wall hydrolase CwlJ-like protein